MPNKPKYCEMLQQISKKKETKTTFTMSYITKYYLFINYNYSKFYIYLKYYKYYDYTNDCSFNMVDFLFSLWMDKLNVSNVERSSLV